MRILISGGTGMVGQALLPALRKDGIEVIQLTRRPEKTQGPAVSWDPAHGKLPKEELAGVDAVIHLAGENIGSRWTLEKKRRIRDSRVQGTQLLSKTLASLKSPPKVLLSASAIGYYGDRGDELLNEKSPPGTGFLSAVCQEWEQATAAAEAAKIRVAHLRFGAILSPAGGMLGTILPPFKLGLGGVVGSGKQWFSWVAIDDVVSAIRFCLRDPALSGAINVVSPEPVTNRQFTKALGAAIHRPTVIPEPEWAIRIALGEMAGALLLASARVEPIRLLKSGYKFRFVKVSDALDALL